MPSWSSCPCYSHTCLSQIALAMSSLLATFRFLLSLLRTPANASGYFCLISTIKVLPTVEQSYPQFTHEPSSILYFFEWNGCHTAWSCTERGISFYELCVHMASFFFSNGSISEKWFPTALQNGFLYSQDSEKRLPTALRNGLLYSQIRGFQLPLEMGFLYSQDPYFMEWSLLLCLKLLRNHKLQHPEINFSLVYTY